MAKRKEEARKVRSEEMVLPLEVAPLPVGQPVEVLPAQPEDHVEVGVAEVLLQVAPVDVARQPVVGGEEQVQRVDIGRLQDVRERVVQVVGARGLVASASAATRAWVAIRKSNEFVSAASSNSEMNAELLA